MRIFKRNKLMLLPLVIVLVSCRNIPSDSSLSSSDQSNVTESSLIVIPSDTTEEEVTTEESSIGTEVVDTESNVQTEIPTSDREEELPPEESSIPDSEQEEESSVSSESSEPREPGIYLNRTRIGVAIGQTISIDYEVYPADLGTVTWELIPDDVYRDPAIVTPEGEVTGVEYTSDEYQIKGTLLEFEVYVTLMVFFDYDEHVDTFYPDYVLSSAVGRGDRYHNGTTMYAGISPLRNVHYYAYDLKAGMTFNVMGLTRYSYDRPKFYYDFGYAKNNKFIVLEQPFISSDGKAMLLGYDIVEDGEYMVRVLPHNEINTSSDGFSYIKYTFWF